MSQSLHVLHVVPGLMAGGMELAMGQVIGRLDGEGIRHSIVCLKGEPEIGDRLGGDVEIHCMHARPNEAGLPVRLARLIRRVRPTVIHARNWGAWPDTALARLLVRPSVPLVFSFHGLGRAGYMPWRRRMASRALVRMTTELFAVSEQTRDMLVARWGWPAGRTRVISNGVDTERFAVLPGRPDNGEANIGTVGNLRPVKNHALLIRACRRLAAAGVPVRLRIAGEGPERDKLLRLADSVGFADRLTLAGRIDDVPAFLAGLDIFVLSSDSEQHPNALIEAMASGRAAVATRVGSVESVLDGGRCGRIVEPGDEAALSAAVGELVASPTLRADLAAKARRFVCENYSLDRMADAYRELYVRLSRTAR